MDPNPLVSKIAIIGAGVSGLAAAKQLAHHNPVVFEASDSIGGVWKHCSYNSTKLQSARWDYEFSDFPWPDRNNPTFPSHLEILDYLHSYANHFDVLKYVRFNSKVVQLRYIGDKEIVDVAGEPGHYGTLLPGQTVWEIAVQTNGSDTIQWYSFEFVVICIGKYGDVPQIPSFPRNKSPEIFDGKVMHCIDYCKLDKDAATELLKDKKVAVIGCKKSAIDLALEASQFPHERPNQSFLRTILCFLLSPVRHAVSKFIETYLLWKQPLEKYGLKPDHPFEEDYASCQMAIMPDNFFPEADKRKIVFKRASKWWFWQRGIEFDDKTKIEADIVVFATGYDGKKKIKAILPEPFCSLMEFPSGIMPLYRGTIHPLIPNMSFVGYLESVANLHTAEVRSIWLARLVDDKFKLPSVQDMLDQTMKDLEVSKRATRFYKRHCISTYSINHSDEICEEMGWNAWRKKSWLSEAFSPYGSQDYRKEK
ncbi:hypothetical protein FEM48_Zijuj08G0025400 [Ziziphus jujuba var. spinosa]|uniref:Flavin-containing monooxygenase n=1 Tax=Ziziphus jujuba var. spinosa TaxID=714518 RepID=A0A978UWH0_ZIZJJ|nr:hypothetical protein FEM48_Zijuj08G0025400 [Ziziphus jujuba var. spinosa]